MIQPLIPPFALQGFAFVSLKADVLFPLLSVHIKENIINQLQADQGQYV